MVQVEHLPLVQNLWRWGICKRCARWTPNRKPLSAVNTYATCLASQEQKRNMLWNPLHYQIKEQTKSDIWLRRGHGYCRMRIIRSLTSCFSSSIWLLRSRIYWVESVWLSWPWTFPSSFCWQNTTVLISVVMQQDFFRLRTAKTGSADLVKGCN